VTIANNIIGLALRNSGVNGVGQTATAEDSQDALVLLNDMILQWNLERTIRAVPTVLATFPDLATDVPSWTPNENALLTCLSGRLRSAYGMPPDDLITQMAVTAAQLLNANVRQTNPPVGLAANDGTGYGLVYLALRAAGRVTDQQNVTQTSQDVTDATSMLREMLDEWRLERTVKVIPGTLPVLTDMTAAFAPALAAGVANAIVLSLATRLRDAFGLPENKSQADRADRAVALIQANNQQQRAPIHGGIPTTCAQVAFLALRAAGRINDAQSVADGSADADAVLSLLSGMVAQWQRRRWLVWSLADTAVQSTNAASYTVGPTGDFAIPRPDRIDSAFARLQTGTNTMSFMLSYLPTDPTGLGGGALWNNGGVVMIVPGGTMPTSPAGLNPGQTWNNGGVMMVVSGTAQGLGVGFLDIPLGIIESREDYNRITLKGLSTFPAHVWYDSAFPVGVLHPYPIVPTGFEIHIATKSALPVYTTLTQALGVPAEYVEAMTTNLPLRIMALDPKGPQPTPNQIGLARAALNTLRMANIQVSELHMPANLPGRGRGSGVAAGSSPGFMSGGMAW